MFRIFSLIIFVFMFGCIAYILRHKSGNKVVVKQWIIQQKENTLESLKNVKSLTIRQLIKNLLLPLTLLCTFVLAVTGFVPVIFFGSSPSGYFLLVHVTIVPLFSVCMAVISLVWAHKHVFGENDWKYLKKRITRNIEDKGSQTGSLEFWQKICFWLIIIMVLPVILSILLSMYQIFGTSGQEFLLQLHRYSTLLYVIVFISYMFLRALKREALTE